MPENPILCVERQGGTGRGGAGWGWMVQGYSCCPFPKEAVAATIFTNQEKTPFYGAGQIGPLSTSTGTYRQHWPTECADEPLMST